MVNGVSIKEDEIACKKVTAYIPDNPDLYANMSGIDYLNFIADIYEVDDKKREELTKKYATTLYIFLP